jgi:hypothetical protein
MAAAKNPAPPTIARAADDIDLSLPAGLLVSAAI